MSVPQEKIQRAGQIKAIGVDPRHPDQFVVEIPLNRAPDELWIRCFRHPLEGLFFLIPEIIGDKIRLSISERGLEDKVMWTLKNVDRANTCYDELVEKRVIRKKREQEREQRIRTRESKKLENVNERLKRL